MNEKVKTVWRMLRTTSHSLIVHTRVFETYINFALMYMTDHIFLVLPIKDLINKDGKPITTFKLETGKKFSVSHSHNVFVHVVYAKLLHT